MFVFGDVAGQYKTMIELLKKVPNENLFDTGNFVCLGDPNDRGSDSKSVIEFLMTNGKTVQSNHAHILTEAWKQSANPGAYPRYYQKDIVFYNGGIQTMTSYDAEWTKKIKFEHQMSRYGNIQVHFKESELYKIIPEAHIKFLEGCPMYIQHDKYVFTHAPIMQDLTLEDASRIGIGFDSFHSDPISDRSLLWNRHQPKRPNKHYPAMINVHGHNSSDKVKIFTTQYPKGLKVDNKSFQEYISKYGMSDIFTICLDTSKSGKISGLYLPTMELFEQEYV